MIKLAFFALLLTITIVNPVGAAYPSLNFQVSSNVPKLKNLETTLIMQNGSGELSLAFAYNPLNAGFSCISGSSKWDGKQITCTGTQKKQNFTISVKEPGTSTKIILKGSTSKNTARVTYKGSKGKLLSVKPTVITQADASPVSAVILTPAVDKKGKLTGNGEINSGYGVNSVNAPLTGKMNLKKKTLSWKLISKPNKLNFTGKEVQGTWTGKLTGKIGPALVSQSIKIPLQSSNTSRFHGTVTGSSSGIGGQPKALKDVTVLIRSDSDGNGSIAAGESQEIKTDENGAFDTTFATQADRTVTVDFILAGYSQTPKMFTSIMPGSDLPINTTLSELQTLDVSGGNAVTSDKKLQLDNLPAGITQIRGKVFNPVTETSQFPGEFADNTGNLLISSVFTQIEAKNTQGDSVSNLTDNTELRMQVPSDTWNTMRDLKPDNDQIDIPFYYYDEQDGQWKRSSSDGWLEDASRNKIPENQLTAIKTGSYSGVVYGAGKINHLSYWNIDWPVDTHGCVTGRLLNANGNPATGAVVVAKGISYTGTSAPVTTDANGDFCIDVMRSEGANEDINQNGINGDKSKISLSVSYQGKYYKLAGEHEIPVLAASCGSTGCLQLGEVKLTENLELTTNICTVTGTVVYSGTAAYGTSNLTAGSPISGAFVWGYDPQIDWTQYGQCYSTLACSLFATTDADGKFTLTIPILSGLELVAYGITENTAVYIGNTAAGSCPTTPITIKADAYFYNFATTP